VNVEQRLAEIEAREQAATPGPWHVDHFTDGHKGYYVGNKAVCVCYYQEDDPGEIDTLHDTIMADFQFVSAARQDIPWLVAEVKRLRAVLAVFADPKNYHVSDRHTGEMAFGTFNGLTACQFAQQALKGEQP